VCGFTIDRDLNATINIMRRGMQILNKTVDENETEHIGRGTPEVMPVETGSISAGTNSIVETGRP
jgi:transposase